MAKKAYVYDGSAWVEITSQPSVASATTGNQGIVQLTDSVTSTSTATAAVPNSVKTAYDQAVTATTNAATAQSSADAAQSTANAKAAVGSTSPVSVASTAVVGTSSEASRADHVHVGVSGITGTANQVIASAASGAVTLSLPQSIGTTSTPTFGATTINGILTGNQSGTLDINEGIILQRTTSLSIATTTLNTAPSTANTTAITWSSAVKANTSMWTTGSAIVAPLAGYYAINLNFQFGTGTSYAVGGYIFQGSTLRAHEEKQAGANTSADMLNVSAIIYCAANDSITARVAASTTSKSITVTSQNGYFSMLYLGAQS